MKTMNVMEELLLKKTTKKQYATYSISTQVLDKLSKMSEKVSVSKSGIVELAIEKYLILMTQELEKLENDS